LAELCLPVGATPDAPDAARAPQLVDPFLIWIGLRDDGDFRVDVIRTRRPDDPGLAVLLLAEDVPKFGVLQHASLMQYAHKNPA
jgi:hypothetical protein